MTMRQPEVESADEPVTVRVEVLPWTVRKPILVRANDSVAIGIE